MALDLGGDHLRRGGDGHGNGQRFGDVEQADRLGLPVLGGEFGGVGVGGKTVRMREVPAEKPRIGDPEHHQKRAGHHQVVCDEQGSDQIAADVVNLLDGEKVHTAADIAGGFEAGNFGDIVNAVPENENGREGANQRADNRDLHGDERRAGATDDLEKVRAEKQKGNRQGDEVIADDVVNGGGRRNNVEIGKGHRNDQCDNRTADFCRPRVLLLEVDRQRGAGEDDRPEPQVSSDRISDFSAILRTRSCRDSETCPQPGIVRRKIDAARTVKTVRTLTRRAGGA